jgi:hypothetical protein
MAISKQSSGYVRKPVTRKTSKVTTKMIDMEKLKNNREYFLDKFDRGLIGMTYVFGPVQIKWLIESHGPNWNKTFIKNNVLGMMDPRFHIGSSLQQFARG